MKTWTDCEGTSTYAKGNKYVGEWKDGKYHGYGTYTDIYGGHYVGEWKDGKHHGNGTSTGTYGEIYVGEWECQPKRHKHSSAGRSGLREPPQLVVRTRVKYSA